MSATARYDVRYDVLGIGNAIVDVIARADDDFLLAHGMRKGLECRVVAACETVHVRAGKPRLCGVRIQFEGMT